MFENYPKPPLPLAELAKHLLEKRHLIGISQSDLEKILQNVGYFRLRGYLYAYRENQTLDWQQIWRDYVLDEKLRGLIFEAISKIEIAFRSQLDLNLSVPYGAYWYKNSDLFEKTKQFHSDLSHLSASWVRVKTDFKHHLAANYGANVEPPAWMIFETSTLGTLSKYFSNLSEKLPERIGIAEHFGFKKSNYRVLKSWLAVLSVVRNFCAHHSRVFSQEFKTLPKIPKNFPKNVPANSIFISVLIIAILLKNIGVDCHFVEKIRELLKTATDCQLQKMGVPANWEEIF